MMFDYISQFILQSHTKNLKTSQYPKEYHELDIKFSFGIEHQLKFLGLVFTIMKLEIQKGLTVFICITRIKIF